MFVEVATIKIGASSDRHSTGVTGIVGIVVGVHNAVDCITIAHNVAFEAELIAQNVLQEEIAGARRDSIH